MILLPGAFPAGLCFCLAVWTCAAPAGAAGISCERWNTAAFFERAGAAEVSRCLEAGAQVNARNEKGLTPLHVAAGWSRTPPVVTALVKAGADLEARDKDTRTPLHHAARFGKTPAVVKVLLDADADPAAKDKKGRTPFDYAKRNAALKDTEVFRRLGEGRFNKQVETRKKGDAR